MKTCLIIGKPNAGKTLFLLNFAEYIGLKKVKIEHTKINHKVDTKEYDLEEAKKILSSPIPYKTQCLQSIKLEIHMIKGKKEIIMMDSSGFTDGIHKDIQIRRAMAQTLEQIQNSHVIFHVFDLTDDHIEEVDEQLAKYGMTQGGYVILGNKIDLLDRKDEIIKFQRKFINHYVIPISALTKEGFREVKSYVCRRL
ncbi:GTPase domain-containing protein [Inediibacterium massiliense]|uniref:GTPase domain-containing protein n=1 Tax=Inediibacterium massiliense TaxID=1658111 RepID=UPI0006B538B0|nr:GTPase domain-containing protein [Inediibacterium massiliense]